jgi:SAM-dependent methyltransferase
MSVGIFDWHFVCKACEFECSTLSPKINQHDGVDEFEREAALRPIRENNFDLILGWLMKEVPHTRNQGHKKLLDVGCAHGWFLEKAKEYYDILGLEPDHFVASRTQKRGLPVREGYFPDALSAEEKLDVIIFNDVLEHIPNVQKILEECRLHLEAGGVVVVNAPDRRGGIYRLSKILARLGQPGAFRRMWQYGLPSPHLYYFDKNSIDRLAIASGFSIIAERELPSIVTKGLLGRIHHTGNTSLVRSIFVAAGTWAFLPLVKILRSDISVWVLQPIPAEEAALKESLHK